MIETHCLSGCGIIGESADYDAADELLGTHLRTEHATAATPHVEVRPWGAFLAPEPIAPMHGPRYVAPAAPTHCPNGDAYRPHTEECSRTRTLSFELRAKYPSPDGAGHAIHCCECRAFLPCSDAIHIAAGLPPRRPFA